MKLKSSIPSNSVKLIDLYNKITTDSLITGPYFQRKLVWKKQHKFAFIETILLNFPFPEIYIASSEVDVENLKTREVVVDGQQRLTTIVDYIQAKNDFSGQNKITPFDELSVDEKKDFLNYSITVKDLKDMGEDNIKEVFKRINSTNYSLNTNEVLNAEFGGGEFAIFCKQLVDYKYIPNIKETDIIIEEKTKNNIIDFFTNNFIFSNNDIKRMFDSQYIMLIISTFLEGGYFGRSSKINYYLEKYNLSFENYNTQLDLLKNSINIIEDLKFSENSYWFNKANLFTLLVELRNIKKDNINLEIFETKLLEFEDKVDLYFNGDENDIKLLTSDEIKYFEVSRQGSHELSAREHRGKVIKKIIEESIKLETTIVEEVTNQSLNIKKLNELKIKYSTISPTETGLTKSIFDAVSSVREFLKANDIHNYETQEFGPTNKVKKKAFFYDGANETELEISMYRSNGRGDYRIWISDIKPFVNSGEIIALYVKDSKLLFINISRYNYSDLL
jgi:hypothetical protein